MKISDIDAFAAVVRCQTLSQAAAELGMTQPAITRRVQNLEEALGVTLLDRNTKPPRPTDIGRQVFEQCRAILREVDALRELTAGGQPPAGEFRVGLTQGLGELMLPGLIAQLATQWPALATQVTTAWGGMLVERVARRELDAALVFLAREMTLPAQVEGDRLLATRLVVVGRRGDWPRRSYRLADCHARGWVLNPDGCGFRAGLRRALDAQ
ncbi:LysR family transcriptional regulator, partial [Burkholderia sp. TJI49]